MALPERTSLSVPIYTGYGGNPWQRGAQPKIVYGSLRGMNGGCGCSPISGCGCGGSGLQRYNGDPNLSGMGQMTSLDQIIANAANWFGGWVQTQLPASASVPPQYGSGGALSTTFQQWLPWIVVGGLAYLVIRR